MTEARQLTMDGREVENVNVSRRQQPPLTAVQRAILWHIREHGSIRSVEAGVILHELMEPYPRVVQYRRRYASADGLEAMKRLAARGLVERGPGRLGVWVAR